MMASGIASIEKLNGENYQTWCIQVKSLLITMDLWNTVVETCPDKDPQKGAWLINDSKALATITLSVKPSELIHIKNCVTAKSAWNILSSMYKSNTASRKVNLFKKLVKFKFQSNEKFSAQINDFCLIVDDLKEIGIALNDDLLSILLLCSLPEEMESFVVAIESRDSLPKYDQLISKILEEEMRQGSKLNNPTENVFAAKNYVKRNKKYFSSNNNNCNNYRNKTVSNKSLNSNSNTGKIEGHVNNINSLKCFRCGKKGHIRSQCKEKQEHDFACSLNDSQCKYADMWILDSGATSHMCKSKENFATLTESKQTVVLASGESIKAEGIGNIILKTEFCNLELKNVLYVPQLHSNFISINKIVKAEHTVKFSYNRAEMKSKNNEKILTADLKGEMFIVNIKSIKRYENIERVCGLINENMGIKWHQRFGHLNIRDLNKLSENNMLKGFNIKIPKSIECVTCAVCKISAKPYKSYASVQSNDLLELVHTDLCGPVGTKTLSGATYFVTFIDDYSRYTTTYFLKNKSDAFEAFCSFAATAEKQTGRQIKIVRSDNGKEFVNSRFKQFFVQKGIVHQTTVSYTPQQNGVSERANRTLVEMARCLLQSSGLPQMLWGEAINTATYIRNRAPTKVLSNMTPYERWTGRKPSVFHLKSFGCDAVVLNKGPRPRGGKFFPKGNKMKFVGYQSTTKGYRLYNPATKQIIISRDVIFFEQSFEKIPLTDKEEEDKLFLNIFESNEAITIPDVSVKEKKLEVLSESEEESNEDEELTETSSVDTDRDDIGVSRKRTRGRPKLIKTGGKGRPRKVYCTEDGVQMLNCIIENPETVAQALTSKNSSKWKEAMKTEFDSLIKNKTWRLVEKPEGKNIIGCKWVFSLKRKPDGSIEKYKARLVAQGCSQKQNVDYTDTFAPVVRHSTIRLLLALSAKYKLFVNHIDIVAAYLNGSIEDDVYMIQPPLFEDQNNPHKVCKLTKALYGLKQAGREWNRKINDILIKLGFTRCKSDTCVYIRRNGSSLNIIAIYVDDMLLACSNEHDMKDIILDLNKHVEATDRGPISFYLGMEVEREDLRGNISIHQKKYTQEILEQWGMANCKPAPTPWPSGTVLVKCNNKCENLNVKNYQSLIGALMYLAVITRPDIMHVVSRLSQFNSHPHEEHFRAAKHVLRYLKNNSAGKITYSSNSNNFECFTDADWGCDSTDRKSYSGHIVFVNGGPVAWESRKQSVVALSTMEAEYIALCQGTKEVIFNRNLLKELCFHDLIANPTTIYCDNQSASFMVKNPAVHKRSKHIDIRYHYIRDQFAKNNVNIEYVPSDENAADILTKVLSKNKHMIGCNLLNLKL